MTNLLERALHTLWQVALGAGLVEVAVPASWNALIDVMLVIAVAVASSAIKTWLQERKAKVY